MAVDTSPGFVYQGLHSDMAAPPRIQTLVFKDAEDLTQHDLVNAETGQVDLAATGDTALLGCALETKTGVAGTTEIEVIINPDAVYSVYDANVRVFGELLDIAGVTGQMGVATPVNNDLIVVAASTAAERTLVMINHGKHQFN